MKALLPLLLIGVAALSRADNLEPAVNTSSAAVQPAAGASAIPTAPGASVPGAAAANATAPAKRPVVGRAAGGPKTHDQIELDTTQITGNRELPNVMYVVPWKKPDLGDFAGRPPKSLLDELLAPVDREVFRRQNRYFAALHPDAAAVPATPTMAPPAAAATTLPAGDEK